MKSIDARMKNIVIRKKMKLGVWSLAFLLSACATVPQGPSQAVTYSIGHGVDRKSGDETLRLVERVQTGAMVGAQAAISMLTGGIYARGFLKDQLPGRPIYAAPEPSEALLVPPLKQAAQAYLASLPDGQGESMRSPLQVQANQWLLVYQHLLPAETPYELRYTVTFERLPDGAAMFTAARQFVCNPEPQVMSLEAWQADNYAAVKKAAEDYTGECLEKVKAQFPDLYKSA